TTRPFKSTIVSPLLKSKAAVFNGFRSISGASISSSAISSGTSNIGYKSGISLHPSNDHKFASVQQREANHPITRANRWVNINHQIVTIRNLNLIIQQQTSVSCDTAQHSRCGATIIYPLRCRDDRFG